jgi:hypothetical protein
LASAWLVVGAALLASEASATEPTKGQCIAANEGAQDLRASGKLLEARAQLAVCVAETCPGAVRQDCAARLADVDKALPTLVVVAKDSAGNDLGDVRATLDGKPLADVLNGTAIPLDPGEHHLTLEAPGLPRTEKTLVLHEGEKARREVVTFAAAPSETTAPSTPDATATPPEQDAGTHPGNTRREIAVVVGSVGLVSLVVGSIMGFVSKGTYDHALDTECGSGAGLKGATMCTSNGVSDVQSANSQATVATVGFVAGAVLLGAGAYIYLSAPRAGDVAIGPAIDRDGAGVSVRGAW